MTTSLALQQWCPMCPQMGTWGWWGMILMGVFWVVVVGLALWLVYRVAKVQGWLGTTERNDDAEEILRERYARGEIDPETYERMRSDLRRGDAGGSRRRGR